MLLMEVRNMTITKLKAKNQVTIPSSIMKRLRLKPNELFAVEIEGNFIKFIPVKVEPKYTAAELNAIDTIVEKERGSGKVMKAGSEFSRYLKKTVA
jgi:bifunctional DNA-binding transcriptional regulator/antitoxin component of YhaV-PrlF toxin-antitoxin module